MGRYLPTASEKRSVDDPQARVATFVDANDMHAPLAYRLLDLVAETGEVAAEAATTTGYGADPDAIELSADEFGDLYFSLLSLAESADLDAEGALEGALEKYEDRLAERGSAGSGE